MLPASSAILVRNCDHFIISITGAVSDVCVG